MGAAEGAHRLVIASSRLRRVWATTVQAASSLGSHWGSYFAAPTARSRLAAGGSEAVELAARHSSELDLILMDLTMPVLDGYEATRRILADDETRHIPVIALSALCEQDTKSKAIEAGCSDCLPKPLDFAVIEELLESLPRRG